TLDHTLNYLDSNFNVKKPLFCIVDLTNKPPTSEQDFVKNYIKSKKESDVIFGLEQLEMATTYVRSGQFHRDMFAYVREFATIDKGNAGETEMELEAIAEKMDTGEAHDVGKKHTVQKSIADTSFYGTYLDRACETTKKTVAIMKKMSFEVNAYLEQTSFGTDMNWIWKPPVVPSQLRKELLSVDGVFCIGTVYNEFTIYLKPENKVGNGDTIEFMEVEDDKKGQKSDNVGDETVEQKIKQIMKQHGCHFPYALEVVRIELTAQMAVENGKTICSPWPDLQIGDCTDGSACGSMDGGIKMLDAPQKYRFGTLGCFVKDDFGNLFGLTCAHVVGSAYPNHAVFINEGEQIRRFATSSPEMTFSFAEHQSFPLVDIAAVNVEKDAHTNCNRKIKDEEGVHMAWRVCEGKQTVVPGQRVFKYGAKTGCTRGCIASADLELPMPDLPGALQPPDSYLIMIESPSDVRNGPFSDRGDSGSIVCFEKPVDNTSVIKKEHRSDLFAMSMIQAGEMTVDGHSSAQSVSFMLATGLKLLSVQLFRNRFLSLQPRFERIAGSVQWKIRDHLQAIYNLFEADIEDQIIANSVLPTKRFIVDQTSLPESTDKCRDKKGSKTRVCLCYIGGYVREPHFTESLHDSLEAFNSIPAFEECFLWDMSASALFEVDGTTIIPLAISDYFEKLLYEAFSVVAECLKLFIQSEQWGNMKTTNFDDKKFNSTHKTIGRIGAGIRAMEKETLPARFTHGSKENIGREGLLSLARIIKCLVLFTTYEKLSIPSYVTQALLVEANFEEEFTKQITPSSIDLLLEIKRIEEEIKTLEHTQKIHKDLKQDLKQVLKQKINNLLRSVIKDILSLRQNLEKEYARRASICTKMSFEINSYLKQSSFGEKIHELKESPVISPTVRQEILRTKGVYCIGTVFNQFTVYLEPDSEDEQEKNVRSEINEVMRRNACNFPWFVKKVTKRPTPFANIQYENGNIIQSHSEGIVGAFVKDHHDRKYGLTCAHLLDNSEDEQNVYIRGSDGNMNLFAKSVPDLTVRSYIIDFAALKINDDVQSLCEIAMRDEDGSKRRWEVWNAQGTNIKAYLGQMKRLQSKETAGLWFV
ncbi:hypothetical protein DPMN_090936, partial [Dreissena polymorpha]